MNPDTTANIPNRPQPDSPTIPNRPQPDRPNVPSCPQPDCPNNWGTLPSCTGLATPWVPFQQEDPQQYAQNDALSNGTLYPALNLPFHLKVEGSTVPATPLSELQALEFVVLELGLYLNTHPDDKEAFTLFQQYGTMEKAAKAAYESKFGPLTQSAAAGMDRYRWLQEPWPWNYSQNEVK